jgi:Rod binding domain-containing protein
MATLAAATSSMNTIAVGPRPSTGQSAVKSDAPTDAQLKKRQEAEKTAQEFETLFVDMMVKSMRKSAQAEDMSNAEDIYQGMLDSEYSKSMTTANNFGIRDKILEWMEQTDPSLKLDKKDAEAEKKPSAEANLISNTDNLKIQNEMWALKAASQAYQLSGRPR